MLLPGILFPLCIHAAVPQPHRFLLVFETSPTVKKELPVLRGKLARLFVSNLQHEMKSGDDVAVWTVDKELHKGVFPLESWMPDDAAQYTQQLGDFLEQQNFTRHATLAAVQPVLNQVIKSSERLTVLVFCDSKSHVSGTPFDHEANATIDNYAAKSRDTIPLVLVLRSYRGQFIGFSVNDADTLDFPSFPPPPPPPKPVAPAVVEKPATPPPEPTGPIVTPVPAIVIIGTHAGTNVSTVTKEAAEAAPAPAPAPAIAALPPPPATNAEAPAAPATEAAPKVATEPLPPVPELPNTAPPASETAASSTNNAASATPAPPVAPPTKAINVEDQNAHSDRGLLLPLALGGMALVAATAIVVTWLLTRGNRPRASLITSSMDNDARPPQK